MWGWLICLPFQQILFPPMSHFSGGLQCLPTATRTHPTPYGRLFSPPRLIDPFPPHAWFCSSTSHSDHSDVMCFLYLATPEFPQLKRILLSQAPVNSFRKPAHLSTTPIIRVGTRLLGLPARAPSHLHLGLLCVYIAARFTRWQMLWLGARSYSSLFLQHPAHSLARNSCCVNIYVIESYWS